MENTSGFVYYVSIAGITGTATPDVDVVGTAVQRIKSHTDIPVVVGFGVRTPEQAGAISKGADGVVVGTALVDALKATLTDDDNATASTVDSVLSLVQDLKQGIIDAT
ncbi:MAG: hypothetical protein COC23_06590 [Hyphomicrobiales bacterium]|nr:MAG: hypothetical protein COC23_06590 [Hyphomicrobiales bacterium]